MDHRSFPRRLHHERPVPPTWAVLVCLFIVLIVAALPAAGDRLPLFLENTKVNLRADPVAPPPSTATPRASGCLELEVASATPDLFRDGFETGDVSAWGQTPPTPGAFSSRTVQDLRFTATLTTVGEGVFRVQLKTPQGHHFQTMEVPIAAPLSSDARGSSWSEVRTVKGYPHPLPLHRASLTIEGVPQVSLDWPLAGTLVVHHGLYGTWTAVGNLVGTEASQCPPALFEIQP